MDHGEGNSPEVSGEASGERSGDGRWLTYDELGRIRSIGRESAVKLVQRKRWRRIPGNDGAARVCVPLDWLTPAMEPSGDHSPHPSPEQSPDTVRLIDTLEGALAALRTRAEADAAEIERLRTAVDRAEQGRDAERVRADALADQANIMQAKLATAEVVVDQARRDARAAQDQVEQLRQADAERRARGVLSRLRAAWRGE
jgi:hypothetical protein